jgi:hypothetical protein
VGVANGISREQLAGVLQASGCDTRMTDLPIPHVPAPLVRPGLYATDWLVAAAAYDLMRSVAPGQPILELEWHAISTVRWRSVVSWGHISAGLWLSWAHGLAHNTVWCVLASSHAWRRQHSVRGS